MSGKYTTGASTKRTTDLKMPVKSDGTKDKRYTVPQFVKGDGTRGLYFEDDTDEQEAVIIEHTDLNF
jgi:hypothetical protein